MRHQQAHFQRLGLWVLLVLGIGASLGLGLFWLHSHERVPAQPPVVGQSLPHAPADTSVVEAHGFARVAARGQVIRKCLCIFRALPPFGNAD